jgi:hypothetical protein
MWNLNERKILNLVLDEIIPGSEDGKIPSAKLLGVIDYLEKKAKEDFDLKKLFNDGICCINDFVTATAKDRNHIDSKDTIFFLKKLESQEPLFFKELLRHTYMGYYSNPSVRPHFGVSSNPPHPVGYEVPPEEPELLEYLVYPVKKRGICYREC